MTAAQQRVREILETLKIDTPELLTHLKEICCERGVFVREGYLDAAEARLTVAGDSGIITVKPNDTYATRTRFSIAHELGHFELHREHKVLLNCDQRALNDWRVTRSGKKRGHEHDYEEEANEFAAELLMPEQFVKADFEADNPGFHLIEAVAEKYETSLFATTRRFIELTPEACVAVFFRGGYVQYVWRSKLFSKQRYRVHQMLDPYTFAFEAALGNETPRYMSAVSASAWFELPGHLAHQTLLEEARYYSSLNLGLSLLWLNRPALLRVRG